MADLKGDAQAKDGQGNPSNAEGNVITSKLFGNEVDGKDWDDVQHSGIKKITAMAIDGIFTGLQLDYVDDGKVIPGNTHGNIQGSGAQDFELNYPSEALLKITGYYGTHNDKVKIKSLIFTTYSGNFPPVGKVATSDKKFEIPGSKIRGLFGRADDSYVYSIGAYYEA